MARKPTETVHLKLRFPEAIRRRLEREARRNNRSMNTEIIHRLQRTFALDDSGAATNLLGWLRNMGVEVTTNTSEPDLAVALQSLLARSLERAFPIAPKPEEDGEEK